MASFQVANMSFGRDITSNELDAARIAAQEKASRRNAALQSRSLDLQQQQQNADIALKSRAADWQDLLNQQKIEESKVAMERASAQRSAYEAAAAADKVKQEEMLKQAKNRQELLDSEMGTAILAMHRNGGNLSEGQLKLFNEQIKGIAPNSQPFDFIGNTIVDPRTGMRQTIGDGSASFMGSFVRNKNGDVVYGDDGSPQISMQRIPSGYIQTVLNSAYGKAYLSEADNDSRERIAQMNNESRERLAKMDNENYEKRMRIEALKLLADMDKSNRRATTPADFFERNPRIAERFSEDYQRDEDGNIVLNEATGEPVKIRLPPEQAAERAVAFFNTLRNAESGDTAPQMSDAQRAIVDYVRALTAAQPAQPTQSTQAAQSEQSPRNDASPLPSVGAMNGAMSGATATQPQGGTQYTPEQIAALKAEKARRDAEKAAAAKEAERQRRAANGQKLSGTNYDVSLTEGSPEWHIDRIQNDKSLSEKSKKERIAYWRRRQDEARQKAAEDLGVNAGNDLAMLEAELNGPDDTVMVAAR